MAGEGGNEYQSFLEDLQAVVSERVEELRTRQSAATPAAFLDPAKVVREWPDLGGRIIEEFK